MDDRTSLGLTMLALSLSMLTISFNAFKTAGVEFFEGSLYFLGIVAAIVMIIFLVTGVILLAKRSPDTTTQQLELIQSPVK